MMKTFATFLFLLFPSLAHARGDGMAVFGVGIFFLVFLWLSLGRNWFMAVTEPDQEKRKEQIKNTKEGTKLLGELTLIGATILGAFVLFLMFLGSLTG